MKVYNPKTKKFEDDETKQNNTSINVYDPSTQTFGNKVKEPEQNTWLRAGALQDGYQFGDIGKTILGTGADILHRGVKGIVKTGEGIGDFGAYLAAQGIETLGNKEYANQVRKAANESLTDKVFAPVDKTLDKNTLLGKKSQGVAESIGQIGAYAATGGLGKGAGTATMFTSAAGSAGNEAYSKENVKNEQAWTKILGGGAISVATENLFGLFGKSGLDTAIANKISGKLTKGISKVLARQGIQATGEAVEEFLEYAGNQLLDMGIDAASKGKGAKFYEDWNWEEVGQQMAGAFIASGIVGAGTTALGVKGTPGSNINEKINNYAELIDIQEGVKPKEQVKLPGIRTEQSLTNDIEQLKEQQKQTTDNKLKQELATKISGLEQELNQFKLPMASTEGMNLMESASKYNIKPETQSAVQQLMENRGIEARWDATKFSDNSVDALWTKDANGNRSVIFNPNASLDTIVEEVALHELTHDILSSENTTLNAQEVLDYVSQLDGYNEARQSLENTYSTMYDPNSAEFNSLIDEEVVADVLGRKLGNQEFINQLVNSKPSVAKSIYNWVISKLNSIVNRKEIKNEKLYWQNIKNKFENAYKQEYKNNEMASTKYKVSDINTDNQGRILSKQQQEYFKNSNVDNTNPTTNEDIRYSKENAEWNEFLDKNLKNTGTTGTLMALHSLSEDKLLSLLDLDGIPVPSLGITDANSSDVLDEFGGKNGVILIFSKDTINPKNKLNEVYSRDIYSKIVPEIYQKVDKKTYNKVMSEFRPYESKYGTFNRDYSYNSSLDKIVNDLSYSSAAKAKFLEDNGYNFEKAYKNYKSQYGFTEDVINKFINEYPELASFNPNMVDNVNEINEIAPKIKEIAIDMMVESNPKITKKQFTELFKDEWRLNDITEFYRDINNYRRLNGQKEFDIYETRDNIDKEVEKHKEEFENWLRDKFTDVYNEKYFEDDSGRKKAYTLENLTSYMKKGKTTAQQKGLFNSYSIGQAKGDAARRFMSIEDIKNARDKLVDVETYKDRHKAFENIDDSVRNEIGDTRINNGEDLFEVYSDYYRALGQTARGVDAETALKNNNYDNLSKEQIQKFKEVANTLSSLPAKYFEAKPQRAVGLNEIEVAVIPNNIKESTRKALRNKGINFVEYDPSVEGDRNKVINKFDNLKFSKNSPEWNNFVNKHIAPEGTKTKLKDIKLPKKEINLPKSTQVKQETRQEVKLPTRETITKEELEELDSLKALNEITDLSREEQNRLDYLEKKQQGYTERYPGLKKVSDFKEISREYGKYRDLDNFDKTLLRDAESMIKGYRNTERRTKDEWLSIARYIGSNFKGNSEELQKYAIQSWFAAAPNQKGSLNRQGKGFVDFKIQEWINSMYDGARVGELDKPSTPKKQTILPMAREDNVLKVNANEIADFMNGISGNQRKWIGTSTESDILKDKVLIKDLDASKLNYVVESNQKSVDTANNHLDTYGYEKSLEDVKSLLRSDKLPKASDVALAERVLQEAVRNGDTKTAQDLIMDIAILGTDLGQATQALSIIKRLTPEGQLSMYTKMIQRAKSRGEKSFENVEITPKMVEMVLNAYKSDGTYDQEDLNNRVEKFKQEIANQMKTTTGEKINAWRYLAMLGNPKTHIRNIVSNVAMNGTIKVKNAMARTLESVLPIENRTKTWKKSSDFIKNYAETTANEMKGIITGENKYNEKSSLESKKRTFKSDTLEKISNFNSNALEAEDWFFSKRAFISNLEEYLTANGINTQEDIESRPEVVEKAKNYAKEQAEIATFRQYSKLAAQINNLEKNNKLARTFIEATVPFKKTPINVAKAGVKYSPLGLIKSLSYDIYQVKQGNMETSQLIDNISQGLTGTSLAILGYALAKNGILNGGGDDDKEGKYDTQLGDNQYSLKIGDKSYSISWLSPVAMPLLVGANAFEQLEEKEEWDMNVVSETLAKTLDPLNEMSFMQGLTNALSSYDKGVEKLAGIGESVAQNYVGQFFPTIFSQFASTIDDKKRSTKASANSTYKFGEQTLRSIMYKLPGLRQQLEVATDVWGNEKEQADNIIQRAYESFLAPYSTTKNITSDLDKEIKSIYNKTNETGVIPSVPYSYIKYKDETYRMSANEYTKYKKTFGQNANKYLNNLISSNAYKNASDDDKAKMIKNTYDYAKAEANEEYFKSQSIDYTSDTLKELNALKKIGINDKSLPEYISNKTLASTIKSNSQLSANEKHQKIADNLVKSNLNDKQLAYLYGKYYSTDDKLNNLVELNIPIKEFIKLNSQDIESDYNERTGKTISNSKKNKVINYVNTLNLSIPQKAILIKSQYNTYKTYDNQIVNYVNNLNKSINDKKVILKSIGFDNYDNDVINYINSQNMSIKDKEKKLKSLGFTIRNGRVYK